MANLNYLTSVLENCQTDAMQDYSFFPLNIFPIVPQKTPYSIVHYKRDLTFSKENSLKELEVSVCLSYSFDEALASGPDTKSLANIF